MTGNGKHIHQFYNTWNGITNKYLFADNWLKVLIVREPLQRLVSCYKNRVLFSKDLFKSADRLSKVGLPVNPSWEVFIDNFERYRSLSPSINHHSAPIVDFAGYNPDFYDLILNISELDKLLSVVSDRSHCHIEMPHKQIGGSEIDIGGISEKAKEKIHRFYAKDYDIYSKYFGSASQDLMKVKNKAFKQPDHSYTPTQEHIKNFTNVSSKKGHLEKLRQSETNQYTLKSFNKSKCIFVHIPKTAGVSVVKSLFGNLAGGHTKIREYKQIYSETEFKNYFKFTFVRNPWDRLVSAYNFLNTGGMNEQDKNWAENNLKKYENFDSFVKGWLNRENIYSYPHFIPQFEFVCLKGLEPVVDFIGYFENLEADFKFVADKLGIQAKLQYLNKTRSEKEYYTDKIVQIVVDEKKDYTEYYNDETVQIIADVYREDIEIFGYDFG